MLPMSLTTHSPHTYKESVQFKLAQLFLTLVHLLLCFFFLRLQSFSHSLLILMQLEGFLLLNDRIFVLFYLDASLMVVVVELDGLFVQPLLVKSNFFELSVSLADSSRTRLARQGDTAFQ